MILYIFIPQAIDTTRALYGPLPSVICELDHVFAIAYVTSGTIIGVAVTATKFAFVWIFKSIPSMDDTFLSFFIASTSFMISFGAVVIEWFSPGKKGLHLVRIQFCSPKVNIDL